MPFLLPNQQWEYNDWRRIVLVRLAQEGEDGKFLYKRVVEHMWEDVDQKSKKISVRCVYMLVCLWVMLCCMEYWHQRADERRGNRPPR